MRTSLALALASTLATSFAACGSPDVANNEDDVIVPDGKEDDFFSTNAREYVFQGSSLVTLEDSLATATAAQKLARAKELVKLKSLANDWFLNQYLIAKESEDSNASYGGLNALVRFGSDKDQDPVAVDAKTFKFTWAVQVAGVKNLMTKLPAATFDLKVGKPSNDEMAQLDYNSEWYRNAPWSSWDPSKASADQVETIRVTAKAQPAPVDSFLPYDRLFADGKVTVGVHFGWDYHNRYDIVNSRLFYNWLVAQGFKSPVDSYEKLLRDSGPLVKSVTSNGKPVRIEVSIFHPGNDAANVPGPSPDTDEGGKVLEADMRESFRSREVIMFMGHSGPLYAFALANWNKTLEGDLDDSKIPGLDMPKSFQVVLANGCDTYALGQAFWQNPNKADQQNLNVITSTSFSNAGSDASARRLMNALMNQTNGKVVPVKVSELTSGLDGDQGWGFDTMYGVHGSDANPRYNPMSDSAKLCQACTTDASCGADGNRCTKLTGGAKVCTFECIDNTGCPTGYSCRAVASSTTRTLKSRQCVPTSLRCQ